MNPAALIVIIVAVLVLVVGMALVVVAARGSRREDDATRRQVQELIAAQQALQGKLELLASTQSTATAETQKALRESTEHLTRTLNDRLEKVQEKMTDSLHRSSKETAESVAKLTERLTVIDEAQKNITKLSTEVVSLQHILSDKQARGAFGEVQLEAIVEDALPPSAYRFQHVLSNQRRADCLILLPNPPGPIVVDAKFPLTSYRNMLAAPDPATRAVAAKQLDEDVKKHIRDIAERYIIEGETADSALMFLPSEAVYAELHAHHPKIVELSHKSRVYLVSPTTMMATLTTVRAILRDVEMRKQASLIQTEVGKMLEDVRRLGERVENLQKHFDQAGKDIDQIQTSARKVTSRGQRIVDLELGDDEPTLPAAPVARIPGDAPTGVPDPPTAD